MNLTTRRRRRPLAPDCGLFFCTVLEDSVTVIRRVTDRPYATIPRQPLEVASELSWRAVGILAYLLTRPDGWNIRRNDLVNRHTEGRDAVQTATKELIAAGYVRHVTIPGGGTEWHVSDVPLSDDEWSAAWEPDRPADGKPGLREPDRVVLMEVQEEILTTKEERTPTPSRVKSSICPDDWEPNDSHRQLADELRVNVADHADKMRDWSKSKGEKRIDWDATFRNWLRRQKEFSTNGNGKRHSRADPFTRTSAGTII